MDDPGAHDCDVLIVGAGINGAGLFRDLCEQGLTCVIVDKGDFGSGTSAAPSRLIHGGLKYLETGQFRLVAESTYERNLLLRNAVHLVRPLPTLIPIHSWAGGIGPALRTLFGSTTAPRSRGALLIKIGLGLYDLYGWRARSMPRHRMLGRSSALASLPALSPGIVAVGTYHDALVTQPERLVLELVEDGLSAMAGARAMNWTALSGHDGGIVELTREDGTRHRVRPRIVVNAAGPWIDAVNGRLGLESRLIGGTKGSHILLDHPELVRQLDGRMVYFEADDGRIVLVFPHHGRALVGSTDIPADDPDAVACDDDEVGYFMRCLRALLPGLAFDPSQIVYRYSGIRPLPSADGVAPGLISRDHSAPVGEADGQRPFAVISLVGGKWTTFRAFSAEVADIVLARLGAARRVSTERLAIGGGRGMPATSGAREAWIGDVTRRSGARAERVGTLLDRYGTTAGAIARHEGAGFVPLPGLPGYGEGEVDWIARNEHVRHLEDILFRRTQLAVAGLVSPDLLTRVADIAANALGWTEGRRKDELAATRERFERRHGVRL